MAFPPKTWFADVEGIPVISFEEMPGGTWALDVSPPRPFTASTF